MELTHFDMTITVMVVIICSMLFGYALGTVISTSREQQKIIKYASKNDMNTMHELLQDLYPFVLWPPSSLIKKEEVKND